MSDYFPRNEFQKLGLSEVALRYLEKVARIGAIEAGTKAVGNAVADVAQRIPVNLRETLETAQAQAGASMPDITPQTVTASHAGTVDSGQLPRSVLPRRYYGDVDVTSQATWTASTDSGSITYTINATTGAIEITALGSSSVVTVTSAHNGVTLSKKLTVTKVLAAAPSSGSGGGTSSSTSTFNSINSASMANITGELTVTTGSTGAVALTAPLAVTTAASLPGGAIEGVFEVYGIWQHDTTGAGAWADLGTEVASEPDCTVTYNEISAAYEVAEGTLSVAYNVTGLAASSSQKFRLRARNSSGTRTMYFSGTASAVGS